MLWLLFGQNGSLGADRSTTVLHGRRQCCGLHVMAFSPVSLVWTGTYLPCWYVVVKLQVNCKFFAVHLVAQENSANLSLLQKFFYFFPKLV